MTYFVAVVLYYLGAALIVYGVSRIYPPLGFVLAGAFLIFSSVMLITNTIKRSWR